MPESPQDWRARAGTVFECVKRPATGSRGMVVTNHPLASAAGAEMIAHGGNAADAAVAALFALTVVEPMMVGLLGGGMAHVRLPDGTHTVLDGLSTAPAAATPTTFTPANPDDPADFTATGRANQVGPTAVANAGNLLVWTELLARHGTLPLEDVVAPAIRLAERGFAVTPYLAECTAEAAPDLARDPATAAIFLPDGAPIRAGARLRQAEAAESLRLVARDGAAALHGGPLGEAVGRHIAAAGGLLTAADLAAARMITRDPVRGTYRGVEIVGPPPPSSGGVHVIQMLNILEGYDIRRLGFGTPETLHLIAEVLKIAFADRAAATADPAFVRVPVERLLSKEYAAERRAQIDPRRATRFTAGVAPAAESPNTTHLTVADGDGMIVCATHTINSTFGARLLVPGTGLIPNNYLALFDPRPGHALSLVPGKRITTSQSPLIALRDGQPLFALGLPGGLRIFGSAMQAVLNLVDHGMRLQEAVEAPRLWTQGGVVEVERGICEASRNHMNNLRHNLSTLPHVGGGMNAVGLNGELLEGVACWRADGTANAIGGGAARKGVRFWPDMVAAQP